MSQAIQKKIEKAESDLRARKEKLAKLRRKLPKKPVRDFELRTPAGKPVRLSSLFKGKSELILVHNMGKSCPYCSMWADGFNGVLKHLENRAAFAVESADSPDIQKKILKKRGWDFNFVSSEGSALKRDLGFADRDGSPWPGVSVLVRDSKGAIFQASKTVFGPGDNYCSVWDLFDLLPKGANGWEARFSYSK